MEIGIIIYLMIGLVLVVVMQSKLMLNFWSAILMAIFWLPIVMIGFVVAVARAFRTEIEAVVIEEEEANEPKETSTRVGPSSTRRH